MLGRVKLMCWILYAISLENVILDYLRLATLLRTDNPYVPVGSYSTYTRSQTRFMQIRDGPRRSSFDPTPTFKPALTDY